MAKLIVIFSLFKNSSIYFSSKEFSLEAEPFKNPKNNLLFNPFLYNMIF